MSACLVVVLATVPLWLAGCDAVTQSIHQLGPPRATGTPYAMDCGPMDENDCHTHGSGIIAVAMAQYPGRHVVKITITSPDGDYWLLFQDGGRTPIFPQ